MGVDDKVSPSKRIGIRSRSISFQVDYECYRVYTDSQNQIANNTEENLQAQLAEIQSRLKTAGK